jgi:hypothetical protein
LDQEFYEDMAWIRHSVYSLMMGEYESESFKRSLSEEWYKAHVWHFLDTVSEIEVLR